MPGHERVDRRLLGLIDDCWAWTNDKDWLKKVKQAVDEYKEMHGGTK